MRSYIFIVSGLFLIVLFLTVGLSCNSSLHETNVQPNVTRTPAQLVASAKARLLVQHLPNGMVISQIRLDEGQNVSSTSDSAAGLAARLYALKTGNYTVTYGDLVATGFWPYRVDKSLAQQSLPAVGSAEKLDLDSYSKYLGTPEFDLRARHQILAAYVEHYRIATLSGKQSSLEGLDTNLNQLFWTNPLTGARMIEGSAAGDYSVYRLSAVCKSCGDFQVPVPSINLSQMHGDRVASDAMCCVFERHSGASLVGSMQFTQCFDNVCAAKPHCCIIFTVSGGYVYDYYTLARKVPCDDPGTLGEGEILRHPGETAPGSTYGGGSCTIDVDGCATCSTLTHGAGWNDYNNFKTGLTAPGNGFVATTTGPEC